MCHFGINSKPQLSVFTIHSFQQFRHHSVMTCVSHSDINSKLPAQCLYNSFFFNISDTTQSWFPHPTPEPRLGHTHGRVRVALWPGAGGIGGGTRLVHGGKVVQAAERVLQCALARHLRFKSSRKLHLCWGTHVGQKSAMDKKITTCYYAWTRSGQKLSARKYLFVLHYKTCVLLFLCTRAHVFQNYITTPPHFFWILTNMLSV